MYNDCDFGGYVTKHNIKCSDGRIISQGAFSDCDGTVVPLVWNHVHSDPNNVLGHAILENRDDGVYGYCFLNDTQSGENAGRMIMHGDVTSMSIYANQLQEVNHVVKHGMIREVSLVLAGANPGAKIDYLALQHSDGSISDCEDEAYIYSGEEVFDVLSDRFLEHADDDDETGEGSEETIQDVFDSFDDDQKQVVYYLIGKALENAGVEDDEEGDDEMAQADYSYSLQHAANTRTLGDIFNTLTEDQKKAIYFLIGTAVENETGQDFSNGNEEAISHAVSSGPTVGEVFNTLNEEQKALAVFLINNAVEEAMGDESDDEDDEEDIEHSAFGGNEMKHNIFDGSARTTLTANEVQDIMCDMVHNRMCLSDVVLAHSDAYGITDINYLFPDAKTITSSPEFVTRRQEWVKEIIDGVHHTPFSRIKSLFADLTADEARAKGYIKGNTKKNQVFPIMKRTTDPTTVYKKQKLDRDDVLDITDFDAVAWMKGELRLMLDEEVARAILVGDGREIDDDDKIDESKIRPVWGDDPFYAARLVVPANMSVQNIMDAILSAMDEYEGTGTPTLYAAGPNVTAMQLVRDSLGRRLYTTMDEVSAAMGVSRIVKVPIMKNLTKTVEVDEEDEITATRTLYGLILNIKDYNVGTDRGGQVSMFDDFDIDCNQMKYLLESRMSGALTRHHSAIIVELDSLISAPQLLLTAGATVDYSGVIDDEEEGGDDLGGDDLGGDDPQNPVS